MEKTLLSSESLNDIITELNWPKPIPFMEESSLSLPYPVESLPPLIGHAVQLYQQYGQQPLPLIACSALSAVSLACQTLANVARDTLLVSPVSMYFVVVAASGERKSAADHALSQSIRAWERGAREQLQPSLQLAKTLHQAWFAEKEGLLGQIRRATCEGKNDIDEMKDQFTELMLDEPEIPVLPHLFFEDTTQEAMVSQLAKGWPSASLWSDEGGIVISSPGMQQSATRFVAMLNRLWDGKPFSAHRKTSGTFHIANRRLTVSLMLQPAILQQMLTKNDGISRQSGFMARCLLAYPSSAMGGRYYQEPPQTLQALSDFQRRLTDCLDETTFFDASGCHNLPTLQFSPQGKHRWIMFFNELERGLKNPHQWGSIPDFVSKAGENVARLAGLFHLFEGKTGHIETDNIERAIDIMHWHLVEARRMLNIVKPEQEHSDANRLIQWMKEKALEMATPRYIDQFCPIRDKARRKKAIETLLERGYLKESRLDNKTTLLVNPHT
ncbi:MAG: DUF3987 domain-containing protein [Legionellales bacterium]|nr:DUF3987 domain-containing protein [Legionellales bacterium]